MDKLKPCPYCNEPFSLVGFPNGKTFYRHNSKDCVLNNPSGYLLTINQDEATKLLNTRPIEDQLRARIAELEARLDIGTGNMYDVVCAENERLRERCTELVEQANTTYAPYRERVAEARAETNKFSAQVRTLEIENDRYETALNRIKNWAEAYPVDIFPEPDFKKVRELLGDSLLSCVSAANMRHVINGVKEIVSAALEATK